MASKKSLSATQAGEQLTRNDYSWADALGTEATVIYGYRSAITADFSGAPEEAEGFLRFTSKQIAVTERIFGLVQEVCGITLTRVNPDGYTDDATILLSSYADETDGFLGYAYQPVEGDRAPGSYEGDFWYNFALDADPGMDPQIATGSDDYNTVIHELGHALGLDHPSDYPDDFQYGRDASYREDSLQYTVMSYFGAENTGADHGGQFLRTLGLHDIAALQRLYGADTDTRAGDDTYGFGGKGVYGLAKAGEKAVFSIWDAGGTDTLNFSMYDDAQVIDLNAEKFSSVGGLTGNVSIARGVVIENAVGGAGRDTIVGNKAANTITGAGGVDRLDGGEGADTLNYATAKRGVNVELAGANWVTTRDLETGKAIDVVRRFENVAGGHGSDRLVGDNGANRFSGNAGTDALNGAGGTDVLAGGAGGDFFEFGGVALANLAADTILDFAAGDRVLLRSDTFTAWEEQEAPAGIDAARFSSGSSLRQMGKGDLLFFDRDDGLLFYDGDGAGAGKGAVAFADLSNGYALRAGDILVI